MSDQASPASTSTNSRLIPSRLASVKASLATGRTTAAAGLIPNPCLVRLLVDSVP